MTNMLELKIMYTQHIPNEISYFNGLNSSNVFLVEKIYNAIFNAINKIFQDISETRT